MNLPWKGKSPGHMLVSGIVQIVLFGVLAWLCLQVLDGRYIEDDALLQEYEDGVRTAATIGLVITGLSVLVGAVRAVVGAIDLTPRRTVEGLVVRTERRRTGDFLPGPVQQLVYHRRNDASSHSRAHRRKHWLEVVVDTADGRSTLTVRPKIHRQAQTGQMVRMKVSPILGYVSSMELLGAVPPPDPAAHLTGSRDA
ncbi:MAG: hypothetical protein ACXIVQ_03180 [Acidimicrobiales bacterium]